MTGLLQFITDFGDQAVLLPSALFVAVLLAVLGWWRGLGGWILVVLASFGTILLLKLALGACGAPWPGLALHSPSGHTMAATVIYGGSALLFAPLVGLRRPLAWMVALAVCLLIGATRLGLHAHSPPEVALAGLVGLAAVAVLPRLAGPPPARLAGQKPRLRLLLVVAVLGMPILLHGRRSGVEGLIQRLARAYVGALLSCGG